MDLAAPEQDKSKKNDAEVAFKSEVKQAAMDAATVAAAHVTESGWQKTVLAILLMALIVAAPLTIYKAIPYAKSLHETSKAEENKDTAPPKTVTAPPKTITISPKAASGPPHLELDSIHTRVRALSQIAASEPSERKAALDERALLIARVKVMAAQNDFKGASPLSLEWLERIKDDSVVGGAALKKELPKPKAKTLPPQAVKAIPAEVDSAKPRSVAPKQRATKSVDDDEVKCSSNDTGICADWRNPGHP